MKVNLRKHERLWVYAVLPVVLLNVIGLVLFGTYYALASQQPQLVAMIPPGQVTFILYPLIAVIEALFVLSIVRRLHRRNLSLLTLIAPRGFRTLKWLPAVGIALLMNLIFAAYVLYVRLLGTWPTFDGVTVWQKLLVIALFVLVGPFCEELIWRGYLMTQLEKRGYAIWMIIILVAISFALMHGVFFPDKLVAVFLIGLANGWYYLQQRNLVPLMIGHAVLNLWSFSLFFFLPS